MDLGLGSFALVLYSIFFEKNIDNFKSISSKKPQLKKGIASRL